MEGATERFLHIESIFDEAMAAPEPMRSAVIARRCEGDSGLAAEVAALIDSCAQEERLMAMLRPRENAATDSVPTQKQIGPYLIDRLLGRGGMGAVYLAHRADGQYEQSVAIKLIDLPLATEVFRERFRQERQILAELQHPFIARLLDGGVTAAGDLYLVMEYVSGTPIDRYCDDKGLSITARIELFLHICEAVQHAHQHFVVHRDLKPDNILVAEDGTPRLLDFGTAKLIAPSVTADSTLTREGYLSFTPQYASPEQVMGGAITSATDSYALGVMLYQLLTGALPYELKNLTTGEMLRTICNQPPRRPEHAAGSGDRLDGDLEAILLKALRKEPKERYLTADLLASDLRAWLKGLPVSARHGTFRYRATKFIRRNRLTLVGVALLVIMGAAGVTGVVWQAQIANHQRNRAEARSEDLRQLSNSLLSELDDAIKRLPGSTGAQQLLVTRVLEHFDRMASDTRGDRQTELDMVVAYTRLGNLQGNGYEQNVGDARGALVSLGKALAIAQSLVSSNPSDREAIRALAVAEQSKSEILWVTGRVAEAVPVLEDAVRNFDSLAADPHASVGQIADAAGAYSDLGDELGQPNMDSMYDPTRALAAYQKDIVLARRILKIDPNSLRGKRAMVILPYKLGMVEYENDPEEAIKDLQYASQNLDALPEKERTSLEFTRIRAFILVREANALAQMGKLKDALPLFDRDIAVNSKLAAEDPKDWRAPVDLEAGLNDKAAAIEVNADSVFDQPPADRRRELAAAEKLLTQTMTLIEIGLKQQPSNDSWRAAMADAQVRLGSIKAELHPGPDSVAISRKGLATFIEMAGKDTATPALLGHAAVALVRVKPASLRDPLLAVACAERAVSATHRTTPALLLALSRAYQAAGQIEKGRTAARDGLALLAPVPPGGIKSLLRGRLEIQVGAR